MAQELLANERLDAVLSVLDAANHAEVWRGCQPHHEFIWRPKDHGLPCLRTG